MKGGLLLFDAAVLSLKKMEQNNNLSSLLEISKQLKSVIMRQSEEISELKKRNQELKKQKNESEKMNKTIETLMLEKFDLISQIQMLHTKLSENEEISKEKEEKLQESFNLKQNEMLSFMHQIIEEIMKIIENVGELTSKSSFVVNYLKEKLESIYDTILISNPFSNEIIQTENIDDIETFVAKICAQIHNMEDGIEEKEKENEEMQVYIRNILFYNKCIIEDFEKAISTINCYNNEIQHVFSKDLDKVQNKYESIIDKMKEQFHEEEENLHNCIREVQKKNRELIYRNSVLEVLMKITNSRDPPDLLINYSKLIKANKESNKYKQDYRTTLNENIHLKNRISSLQEDRKYIHQNIILHTKIEKHEDNEKDQMSKKLEITKELLSKLKASIQNQEMQEMITEIMNLIATDKRNEEIHLKIKQFSEKLSDYIHMNENHENQNKLLISQQNRINAPKLPNITPKKLHCSTVFLDPRDYD